MEAAYRQDFQSFIRKSVQAFQNSIKADKIIGITSRMKADTSKIQET